MLVRLAGVLGGLLLLAGSIPVWFPWVFKPVARQFGLSYARYERNGYSRFGLREPTFARGDVSVKAGLADVRAPWAWLWGLAFAPDTPDPFIRVDHWELRVAQPNPPDNHAVRTGAYEVAIETRRILSQLRRWLPTAALSGGSIHFEKTELRVAEAHWMGGALTAEVELLGLQSPLEVQARLGTADSLQFRFHSEALGLNFTNLVLLASEELTLEGLGHWRKGPLRLSITFPREAFAPVNARLDAPAFEIPAAWLGLPQYDPLRGALQAVWQKDGFVFSLQAGMRPGPEHPALPPLELQLRGRGNTRFMVVESLCLRSPWASADLEQPMQWTFTERLLRDAVHLCIHADLANQPFASLAGTLEGRARLRRETVALPDLEFFLSSSNLVLPPEWARLNPSERGQPRPPQPASSPEAVREGSAPPAADTETRAAGPRTPPFGAGTLQLAGVLRWPWLSLTNAEVAISNDTTFTAQLSLNLQSRLFTNGQLRVVGPLPRGLLPAGYACDHLSVAGFFAGALDQIEHNGSVEVRGLTTPQFAAGTAGLDWSGRNFKLSQAKLKLQQSEATLEACGTLSFGGGAGDAVLQSLNFLRSNTPVLELAEPFRVEFKSGPKGGRLVRSGPFRWVGGDRAIEAETFLAWPGCGGARVMVRNTPTGLFKEFLRGQVPNGLVKSFEWTGGWTNGPLQFDAALAVSTADDRDLGLSAQISAIGDGLTLSNLILTSPTGPLALAAGRLPLAFRVGGSNWFALETPTDAPLQGSVVITPNGFLQDELRSRTGLTAQNAALDLQIGGTWAAPQARGKLTASALVPTGQTPALPSLRELEADLEVDRERLAIASGRATFEGRMMRFDGRLPLGNSYWAGVRTNPAPDWRRAAARVRLEQAPLAWLADGAPDVLAPQGTLSLDVALQPGLKLEGELQIVDGRTRPLPGLGPVRDINLRLEFLGDRLRLASAGANIGGSPLGLQGEAKLSDNSWRQGALPPFEVALTATNVPLARQAQGILRADLDLTLTRTNADPPRIAGRVRLRDSFFLSNLDDLVPGGVATPGRRPPYFSVPDPPLAEWRLAVRVEGDRFLRVITPLLRARASANFKLEGTLKEPVAVGDLTLDAGQVLFPFATLDIQQGRASLSSANPFEPQLTLQAASRRLGYDIRMEVSGPASSPLVQFSSTPPLSSDQILLLVTAGEMPQAQQSISSRQRAQSVAFFLGRDLLSRLGYGDTGEERLTVRSGADLSEAGRPTYDLEYKLSDRWSLTGEYDRFGAFNVGAKWRVWAR